jgi:hypothetical protein
MKRPVFNAIQGKYWLRRWDSQVHPPCKLVELLKVTYRIVKITDKKCICNKWPSQPYRMFKYPPTKCTVRVWTRYGTLSTGRKVGQQLRKSVILCLDNTNIYRHDAVWRSFVRNHRGIFSSDWLSRICAKGYGSKVSGIPSHGPFPHQ